MNKTPSPRAPGSGATEYPPPAHTVGAIQAAEIITNGEYRSPKRYKTVYGLKTCLGIADIIDRETHAPDLLAALRHTLRFVDKASGTALGIAMSGKRHPNPDEVLEELSREGMALSEEARAAIARAEGRAQ